VAWLKLSTMHYYYNLNYKELLTIRHITNTNCRKIPLIRENAAVCQINDIGYIL